MGNVVAGEALRRGGSADLHIMMQAAVSAGAYDPRPRLLDGELVAEDLKNPTPDASADLGYRNLFANIRVPTINFYNTEDYALQTGNVGKVRANWIANQLSKPDNPPALGEYAYRDGIPGFYRGKRLLRAVTDIHESLAFIASKCKRVRLRILMSAHSKAYRQAPVVSGRS